ncbi:MAG: hypothetical protein H3C43_02375 [Leptonema sp. (in: Bacteria)]|nr:hypothetical protein [Leptonema sp. (in: bacteria)]
MIYSEFKLAQKIFQRFLSPNASRGGYFEGMPTDRLFKPGVYPIPIHFAPVASLDAIWIDSQHCPTDSRQLTALIQTLAPAGIAAVFLNGRQFSRKQIFEFCRSAGLQILFLSPIPSSGKIKLSRSGLPIPKNFFRRILLRLSTFAFPFLQSLLGSQFLLVAQRSPKRQSENSGVRISVVIPIVEGVSNKNRLQQWEDFVTAHRLHQFELVCVEDENQSVESKLGSTIRIQHSTKTGIAGAIRTGIIHSSGQLVLIDSTENRASPAFLFDLLLKRSESKSKADVIVCVDANTKPNLFRRFKNRLITGFSDASPLMILLNEKAANSVIELHNDQIQSYRYSIELKLGSSKLNVEEVELYLNPTFKDKNQAKSPSFFQYLMYRFRRGMVYFIMPFFITGLLLLSSYMANFITTNHHVQSVVGKLTKPNLVNLSISSDNQVVSKLNQSVSVIRSKLKSYQFENAANISGCFFFNLILGQLIHVSNALLVFRRPSNNILFSWAGAQFEAVLILWLPIDFSWFFNLIRFQEFSNIQIWFTDIQIDTFSFVIWFVVAHLAFGLVFWFGFRRVS